jgi:hypothetical protein
MRTSCPCSHARGTAPGKEKEPRELAIILEVEGRFVLLLCHLCDIKFRKKCDMRIESLSSIAHCRCNPGIRAGSRCHSPDVHSKWTSHPRRKASPSQGSNWPTSILRVLEARRPDWRIRLARRDRPDSSDGLGRGFPHPSPYRPRPEVMRWCPQTATGSERVEAQSRPGNEVDDGM